MITVYVIDQNSKIAVRGGKVIVSVEGDVRASWPIEQVSAVVCYSMPHITPYGLGQLADANIDVHLLTRGGRHRAVLTSGNDSHAFLQLAQAERWRDEGFRLMIARCFVTTKVANQRAVLRAYTQRRAVPGVGEVERRLTDILATVPGVRTADELLGYEGLASRHYFGAFGRLLRRDVLFEGRSRRPPKDPPNALLSLGYTLLGTDIGGQLEVAGFMPRVGFLHSLRYGRASLAQDVLEEFRQPVVDRWVLRTINQRTFSAEDFESRDGGVYLTSASFRRCLRSFSEEYGAHKESDSWRNRVARRLADLREAIMDGVEPPPFETVLSGRKEGVKAESTSMEGG